MPVAVGHTAIFGLYTSHIVFVILAQSLFLFMIDIRKGAGHAIHGGLDH